MNRKRTQIALVYALCTIILLLLLPINGIAGSVEPNSQVDSCNDNPHEDDEDEQDDSDDCFDELVIKISDPDALDALLEHYNDNDQNEEIERLTVIDDALASYGIYLVGLNNEDDDAETLDDWVASDEWDNEDGQDDWAEVEYVEPHYMGDAPEIDHENIWIFGGYDYATAGLQYIQHTHTPLDLSHIHRMTTGEDTVVAIIDTGLYTTHSHFLDTLSVVDGWDFVDDDNNPSEEPTTEKPNGVGHGTHVAGIVHTVAPSATIMPLRALDTAGQGTVFNIAKAIFHAIENDATVINLSLGTTYESELLQDAVTLAQEEGILVVAAAGNANNDEEHYPAAFDTVLSVTSVDKNGQKSTFAGYGDWINIAAQGEDIFSAIYDSRYPNGYARWSGTSMAAPFVSGEAALLAQLISSASAEAVDVDVDVVRNAILTSTVPITNQIELDHVGIANIDQAVSETIRILNIDSDTPTEIPLNVATTQTIVHTSTIRLASTMLFIALALITKTMVNEHSPSAPEKRT